MDYVNQVLYVMFAIDSDVVIFVALLFFFFFSSPVQRVCIGTCSLLYYSITEENGEKMIQSGSLSEHLLWSESTCTS
jgi:hypothetical protein